MKSMDFAKGMAFGVIAGGAVACVMTLPKKKRVGLVGRMLKSAGNVVESLSDAFGV